jgi:hypothetical protein
MGNATAQDGKPGRGSALQGKYIGYLVNVRRRLTAGAPDERPLVVPMGHLA